MPPRSLPPRYPPRSFPPRKPPRPPRSPRSPRSKGLRSSQSSRFLARRSCSRSFQSSPISVATPASMRSRNEASTSTSSSVKPSSATFWRSRGLGCSSWPFSPRVTDWTLSSSSLVTTTRSSLDMFPSVVPSASAPMPRTVDISSTEISLLRRRSASTRATLASVASSCSLRLWRAMFSMCWTSPSFSIISALVAMY